MNAMINTSIASLHAAQRVKERRHLKNSGSVERNMQLALQRGKRAEDCTSWEREFLNTIPRNDCTAIAYNNFCYIFSDSNICVTVYALPAWFGKKKAFNGKERIRNYKSYYRHNTHCFMENVVC